MQNIPSEEVLVTASQSQFVESELVEYGKIEEITQSTSGGSGSDTNSYS